MDKLTKLFVKMTERENGQTMAEYALVGFGGRRRHRVSVAYEKMGTTITTLLGTVDSPALIRAWGESLTRRGASTAGKQKTTMSKAETNGIRLPGTTGYAVPGIQGLTFV